MRVAPHAGAGIETREGLRSRLKLLSPPTRGRELKHYQGRVQGTAAWSPPTRGRELKHLASLEPFKLNMSPPTRGRELKLIKAFYACAGILVAPHAGAGIETSISVAITCSVLSPPTRGRELKQP